MVIPYEIHGKSRKPYRDKWYTALVVMTLFSLCLCYNARNHDEIISNSCSSPHVSVNVLESVLALQRLESNVCV